MNTTSSLLLIKDAAAAKAGAYSSGAVLYQLVTDTDRTDVYLAITGNQGGSGYFSREVVPFAKVCQCVADVQPAAPLPSKTFMPAFTGRSTNNAGFLAAILRAEGLLIAAPEVAHHHMLAGDWQEWRAAQLARSAELLPDPCSLASQPTADTSSGASMPHSLRAKKHREGVPGKRQYPTPERASRLPRDDPAE